MHFRLPFTLLVLFSISPLFLFSQNDEPEVLHFEYTTLDLGDILCSKYADERGVILLKYPFTNVSEDTLVIGSVKTSGGPFVPYQYMDPIPPQGKGEISARYFCQGRIGLSHKSITVSIFKKSEPYTNPRYAVLRLKLNIIPEKE